MENQISRVIVTKDNAAIGIITAKDLLPFTTFVGSDKLQSEKELEEVIGLTGIGHVMIAGDLMKKPITVEATDDLADAAWIMTDKRISGLPVVNPNSKDLEGIITKTDIVNALIESTINF
jgi:CBS domain-containing protein